MTEWRTAWVQGISYPANGIMITMQTGIVYATYIFSQLILTTLEPGELVTMVSSNQGTSNSIRATQ